MKGHHNGENAVAWLGDKRHRTAALRFCRRTARRARTLGIRGERVSHYTSNASKLYVIFFINDVDRLNHETS